MAVFRHFRVGYGPAIVGAVLYSFLPSRLLKGQGHLFLDVFYQVPLAVLVLLWVCSDQPPLVGDRGRRWWPAFELRRARSWGSLVIAGLVASTSLYYAFFTTCLLVAGGIWASIERRSMRNAFAGAALASVIVVGLGANGIPSILYRMHHGPNHAVAERGPLEAEYYGMKIAQLLLPVDGHRLQALRQLKDYYSARAPLAGENGATSLGLVGDVGFLVLLWAAVSGRRSERAADEAMRPLGVLNLIAVLLGTIGGFGSLFALLVSPQIRTYCRVNVLIGFFALFAVVLLVDRLRRWRPRLALGTLPIVLVLGLLDQATPAAVRPYAATKKDYASDADLVRRIEATVPAGTAVFELPYMGFPDSGPVQNMLDYDPIRPYLHSRALRWSYPAMYGRAGDAWARDVSQSMPGRMLETLKNAGFGGLLIDRYGFTDGGCAIEAAFRTALGVEPLVSPNNRLVFFTLAGCEGGACDSCGAYGQPCCDGATCRGGSCNHGTCECGILESGGRLSSGKAMASCDGRFSLTMNVDGDLVVRGCGCTPAGGSCWSAHSSGHAGAELVMQRDGDLVISGDGCGDGDHSCWSSNSAGHAGAFLKVQNDGNVCILGPECTSANGTCWCSDSCCH